MLELIYQCAKEWTLVRLKMYKLDLALNKLQGLIYHKTQPTKLSDRKSPVLELEECKIRLHYHYSQIHSDPEW